MELLLLTAAPSIAAVIIYAMKIKKDRPPKFVHEHIWEPWELADSLQKSIDSRVIDIRDQYSRTCIDCGDKEFKVYSRWENEWV